MSTTSKKNPKKTVTKSNGNGNRSVDVSQDENVAVVFSDSLTFDQSNLPRPVRINPETAEEREKRLAKRKTLTLRVFRSAYENHHQRKVS